MTVTLEEFEANWQRLEDCLSTVKLTPENLKGRHDETWRQFRVIAAGGFEAAVTYYLENSGDDPFFPTPGQLVVAKERSDWSPRRRETEPELTAEEKARLRKETAEWAATVRLDELGQKIISS